MKVVFSKHGSPESVISMEKVDSLPPVDTGSVRVKILAAPVNPADRLYVEGNYNALTAPQFPMCGGSEGAGVVSAVGAEVDKWKVGDRVYVSCNFPQTGTWGTYVDVSQQGIIVKLPDAVQYTEGCQVSNSNSNSR
jgi:NADPH:quinone reductase-like Zn-dependent oxidoreductase